MVVIGVFMSQLAGEKAVWLVGNRSDEVYEERIGENETLLSVRAHSLPEAEQLRDILYSAGAKRIEIDVEAA